MEFHLPILPAWSQPFQEAGTGLLPIPYNKHCKIVLEKDWGAYYQITYSTMPEGTQLPDFTGEYSREDCFALAETDRYLYNRGFTRKIYEGETTENVILQVRGNSASLVKNISGNRALTYFSLSLDDNYISNTEKTSGPAEKLLDRNLLG